MSSLKEIKGRIASVNNTLKITSAMKMVASSRLRKAQDAIGNMVAYQQKLGDILVDLMAGHDATTVFTTSHESVSRVALVCFASNSSLCGAFNSNAIREATKVVEEYRAAGVELTVYSVGRKMADAMRRLGYESPADYSKTSSKPTYDAAAELGRELTQGFLDGRFDKVELVYNHYKSAACQPSVRETYLPLAVDLEEKEMSAIDFIVEPDRETQIGLLLPKVLRLKMYTVLLDTVAAEHAARTVAMQTATDNGNSLLVSLTLEYNKNRQQKITSEILDLESGALN